MGKIPISIKMDKYLEQLLFDSDRAIHKNHQMSEFFNNTSMARLLDIFLSNPNLKINIDDALNKTSLSQKSKWVNFPKLVKLGIITEERYKHHKFYQLNSDNEQVKQISQFRDILTHNNASTDQQQPDKKQNRRIDTKLQQKRRTRQPKKVSRKV
jgi:hypothetical protein